MLKNQEVATGLSLADEVLVLRERLAALQAAIDKIDRAPTPAADAHRSELDAAAAATRAGRSALADAAAVVRACSRCCASWDTHEWLFLKKGVPPT